jgi:hypothetical protein
MPPVDPRPNRIETGPVEIVVNGGVHAEKCWADPADLKRCHLALSSSHDLMRILPAIVHPEPLPMRQVRWRSWKAAP